MIAGVSVGLTYLLLRKKDKKAENKKSTLSDDELPEDKLLKAQDLADKIMLLDSNLTQDNEEGIAIRNEKREKLMQELNKLGYDLQFQSYQRTCNSEPCTTKYVLLKIEENK